MLVAKIVAVGGTVLVILLEVLPGILTRLRPMPRGEGWHRPGGLPGGVWVRESGDGDARVALWTGQGYEVRAGTPDYWCDSCVRIGEEWWAVSNYPLGITWRRKK